MDLYNVISISEYGGGILQRDFITTISKSKVVGVTKSTLAEFYINSRGKDFSKYTLYVPFPTSIKASFRLLGSFPLSPIADADTSGRLFHTARKVGSAYVFSYCSEVCVEASLRNHTLSVLKNAVFGVVRRNGRFFIAALSRKTKIGKCCALTGWGTVTCLQVTDTIKTIKFNNFINEIDTIVCLSDEFGLIE